MKQNVNERMHRGLGYLLTVHCYGKSGVRYDATLRASAFSATEWDNRPPGGDVMRGCTWKNGNDNRVTSIRWLTEVFIKGKPQTSTKIICLDTSFFLYKSHSSQNRDFPGGTVVKNLPANATDMSLIPGSGRFPGDGNGNPLQYSCLGNPLDQGAWQATVHGVTKSRTQLTT